MADWRGQSQENSIAIRFGVKMNKYAILTLALTLAVPFAAVAAERPDWFSRTTLLEKSVERSRAITLAEARREAEASRSEVYKKLIDAGLEEDVAKEQIAKMTAALDAEFKKLAGDSAYKLGDAADLEFLFQLLYLANNDDDSQEAARIIKKMFPDASVVKAALSPEASADFKKALAAMYDKIRPAADDQKSWIGLMNPPSERNEIKIYGATTEEIIANKGVVAKEFPGGAVELAKSALRMGIRFYEVEMVQPGEESGTKFHLFFWDGIQWRMLGPAWRAL
ncbi:MAG: hypothetical protein ACI9HK_002618 [Pirellulaceae bacterium]